LFVLSTPKAFAYEKVDFNDLITQTQMQRSNSIQQDQYMQQTISDNKTAHSNDNRVIVVEKQEPLNIYLPHAQ
jgi:hypothetical protein